MKRSLFSLCLIILFTTLSAQESKEKVRVKEAGITFSSLNNFGLTYRIGNQNAVWRFNSFYLSGGGNFYDDNSYHAIGFSLNAGREYRKSINDQFQFRYGADASFGYNVNTADEVSPYVTYPSPQYYNEGRSLSGGLNLVLGLNYILKNNLVIGAEVLPYINYTERKSEGTYVIYNGQNYVNEDYTDINTSYSFGIINQSVILSVTYRY